MYFIHKRSKCIKKGWTTTSQAFAVIYFSFIQKTILKRNFERIKPLSRPGKAFAFPISSTLFDPIQHSSGKT